MARAFDNNCFNRIHLNLKKLCQRLWHLRQRSSIRKSCHTTSSFSVTLNKIINNRKKDTNRHKASPTCKVNYKQLGIAGLCLGCGKIILFAKEWCSSLEFKSEKCGHVAKVYIPLLLTDSPNSGHNNNKSSKQRNSTHQVMRVNSNYEIFKIIYFYRNNYTYANSQLYYAKI